MRRFVPEIKAIKPAIRAVHEKEHPPGTMQVAQSCICGNHGGGKGGSTACWALWQLVDTMLEYEKILEFIANGHKDPQKMAADILACYESRRRAPEEV